MVGSEWLRKVAAQQRYATAADITKLALEQWPVACVKDYDGVVGPFENEQLIRLGLTPWEGVLPTDCSGMALSVDISARTWLTMVWRDVFGMALRRLFPGLQPTLPEGSQFDAKMLDLAVSGHWFKVASKLTTQLSSWITDDLEWKVPPALTVEFVNTCVRERLRTFPIVPKASPGALELFRLCKKLGIQVSVVTSGYWDAVHADPVRWEIVELIGERCYIAADNVPGLTPEFLKPHNRPWKTGTEACGVQWGSLTRVWGFEDASKNFVSMFNGVEGADPGHAGLIAFYMSRERSFEEARETLTKNGLGPHVANGQVVILPGGDTRPVVEGLETAHKRLSA